MNQTELSNFLDDVLNELQYRIEEGIINLNNPIHKSILSEILHEQNMDYLLHPIMDTSLLIEAEPKTKDKPSNPNDDKYSHLGNGIYVKKGSEGRENSAKFKKDDNGNYKAISHSEAADIKQKAGEDGGSNNNPQAKTADGSTPADVQGVGGNDGSQVDTPSVNIFDDEYQKRIKDQESVEDDDDIQIAGTYDDAGKRILAHFQDKINKSSMDAAARKTVTTLLEDLSIIYNKDASTKEKIAKLSSMNISISSNKKKLYLDDMRQYGGGLYKILGDGTKALIRTINELDSYIQIPDDDNNISVEVEAAAKPDLGKQNVISLYEKNSSGGFTDKIKDTNVEKLFNTPPLDRITLPKFKSVYGPTDNNGNLLSPSSAHSKEFLKFSIENNVSISNTIKVLEKYALNGSISPQLAISVKNHQKRMHTVLNTMKIPSEEASIMVDNSYSELFDELMHQDADLAARMLKQFAEMRLYDSEIANGDEAYLPGNGSFPAGDKLVVNNGAGGVERVSFISVKYGKNGDVYGCPANSKALQLLHPDTKKRELQGQHIGESGYTLAVNDELIKDLDTTKKSIKKLLGEIPAAQNIFSNDDLDEVSNIVLKTKKRVDQLKMRYQNENGKLDKVGWGKLHKDLMNDSEMIELNSALRDRVSVSTFSKIIGSRNGRVASKNDFGAAHFMSGIILANQVITSNGFDGLSHNKQYYKDGVLKTSTLSGTTDMDEWYINFRMYRTAGRNGGGAQISYVGLELKEKFDDSQIGYLKS